MSQRSVEVALPPPVARELTYGVPADMEQMVVPGSIVLVPVQQRLVTGFVTGGPNLVAEGETQRRGLRDITQVLDTESSLSPEILELCQWMSRYYLAPVGSALAAALPPGIRSVSSRLVTLTRDASAADTDGDDLPSRVCRELATGPLKVSTLRRRVGGKGLEQALRHLRRMECVEIHPVLTEPEVSAQHEQIVCINDVDTARQALADLGRRAPRQTECLSLLIDRGSASKRELVAAGFSYQIIQGLMARGLIEAADREVVRDPLSHLEIDGPEDLEETPDQLRALETILAAIEARHYFPVLLKGVTGSGKTLVYIRATESALAQGSGVLILVPEIALAWQMVRRFKAHFGDRVAVMHSQLSNGERYDTWRRIQRGEQTVVIGARSAVLAPLSRVGLIVVDEEQDGSYFQDDVASRQSLAYSARDVALVRGRLAEATVILGSATPSLESYWNARSGKYHLLELPRRVDDRPLARVEVVDMRKEPFQRQGRTLFSRTLRLKIRDRLERQEQIVLLQNRRGFAPIVLCTSCGETVQCRSCRVSLTCHRSHGEELRCHYCDYRQPLPRACPHCGSSEVRLQGAGTQRVEEALLEQFPGTRVIRMDVDTTGWKGAHDELVERFRHGEADVLLGTQMVAKGLDFPRVTLVGVISADTGLHLPDFRAPERSFQLLTQVAGRSGRGHNPGEVVIQTMLPEAATLRAAAQQDYDGFAEAELAERRESGFPPFGRLLIFRWSGPDEGAVERAGEGAAQLLKERCCGNTVVLGPAPAPLARLRDQFRWQALLLGPSARDLRTSASGAMAQIRRLSTSLGVEVSLVVDAQNTM